MAVNTMNHRSCGYDANICENCCETLRLQVETIFNAFFGSRRQYRQADKKTDDQPYETDNDDNDDNQDTGSNSSDSSFSTVISSNSAGGGGSLMTTGSTEEEGWVHCTGAGELSTHDARASHGGMAPRLLH